MDLSLLFPLIILVLFIPIFLSSRKQKRQQTEMQSLQQSLQEGDVVMTTSGMRATVVDASYEDTVDLEIAEGVVTTWVRAAVREKVALPAEEHTESDHVDTQNDETAVPDASASTPPSLEKSSDPASDASRN